jgi:DNA ligase-1
MNASQVYDHIEKIAATSSKKEKEALIKEGGSCELFMRVLKAAYDPFAIYGIDKVPEKTPVFPLTDHTLDKDGPWVLLDHLRSRKVTGNQARDFVAQEIEALDAKSSTLFRRILKKDLRAGFTDGTVNRVFPGTFPDFPYMRCSLPAKSNMQKWSWWEPHFSQEKADGSFANVTRVGDTVSITTRQGTPYPTGALGALENWLIEALAPDTQTHGELLVYEVDKLLPRELGNGVLNSLAQGGTLAGHQNVVFVAWDQIPLSAVQSKGKDPTPYRQRFVTLARQLQPLPQSGLLRMIETRLVRTPAEAFDHYRELLARGREGTILKHAKAEWKDGTNKDQVKLKLEVDLDLWAVQIMPGRADTKNAGRAGAIRMQTSCGALEVDVAIKNEAMRDAVDANPQDFLSKVYVVRANALTLPSESNAMHSLFLPRFVEASYRTDKTVADDLESVKAQFQAAMTGQAIKEAA